MATILETKAAFERYDALRKELGVSLPEKCIFWKETESGDRAIAVYADGVGGASWMCMDSPPANPTSEEVMVLADGKAATEQAAITLAKSYWRSRFGRQRR